MLLLPVAFLRDHGIHLSVAAEISRLYQAHPDVLPFATEWNRFAVLLVNLLAGYRRVEGEDSSSDAFERDTAEVSRMLPLVWGRSEDTDGIQECLKAFYIIISTEGIEL